MKDRHEKGKTARPLKTRVKTARGRKSSSTRWLQRQLNDPYVARAKASGFRSRAAFKLIEIDEKLGLLREGQTVIDLGAAPGGWSQVAAEKVGTEAGKGRVIAIDRLPIDPIAGVEIIEMDFMDRDAPDRLKAHLGGPADLVLSDMAPNTTGHRQTDHWRSMALCEAAMDFAASVLVEGGGFVAKVLRGGTEAGLLTALKKDFEKVRHVKPKSSRSDSNEMFVVATGFRATERD